MYLVDGAQNVNRMDGGYALKHPGRRDRGVPDPDAERAARIRRHRRRHDRRSSRARAAISLHGSVYEFVRNDAFDARNFFSEKVEPLDAEPVRRHGRRADADATGCSSSATTRASATGRASTTTATVPTPQERQGDFSGMGTPLINFAAGGVPFPGNQIPAGGHQPGRAERREPVSRSATSRRRSTARRSSAKNVLDQVGGARRRQRDRARPGLRPLLLLGRPQHQPDLGARHRRARAFRRATTSATHSALAVEHAHLHRRR